MAGDTGQGQTAKLGATVIPNVKSITTTNTGNVITETVADGVLSQVMGAGWSWTVEFIMPTTATHTLEGALKSGTTGALEITQGKTKYTSATGRSSGFTKTSPSNGFISCQLTLVIDNDPTLAATA